MKRVKDHLGNEFNSVAEMCRHYGINNITYVDRIKAGWTVEQSLTTPVKDKCKKCKDHLGNEYNSIAEMCNHYNIKVDTFYNRVRCGWKLKQILETPVHSQGVIDNGVKFESKEEFANFHNMSITRYRRLTKEGYTLDDDRNNKIKYKRYNMVTDPFGKNHKTLAKMLKFYDISKSSYFGYMITGRTLKDLLIDKMNGRVQKFRKGSGSYTVVDHLGKTYDGLTDMCRHYGIAASTLRYRLLFGWSLEKALTSSAKDINTESKLVEDHLGNKYTSVSDMCRHYNVNLTTYITRIKAGCTVEEALTTPVKPKKKYNRD